jgi:hypothetical protein
VKRALVVVMVAGCAGAPSPKPAEPIVTPVIARARTCTEAALGLEHGTMDVRSPDSSILQDVRLQCASQTWPADARACFTEMQPGDLGRCATKLSDRSRDSLFSLFAELGDTDDRTQIALAEARLDALRVNIAECDQFLGAVRTVIACEALPASTRAELGRDVSDVWSLPTQNLPESAARQMAQACSAELAALEQLDYPCRH